MKLKQPAAGEVLTKGGFYAILGVIMVENVMEKTKIRKNLPFSPLLSKLTPAMLSIEKNNEIQKIYLFGSYAYGKPHKDSDLDLCVVLDNVYSKREFIINFYYALEKIGIIYNYDLLIYRENDFYSSENPESVENTIINKGILLYERKESN